MYPKTFMALIESFKTLPGVGEKAAERYAYAILEMSNDQTQNLANTLIDVKNSIKYCSNCHHISDNDLCDICSDNHRDNSIICIVNTSKDLIAIEKTKEYNGVYHVLLGEISPTKGVMPEDLTIDHLMLRLDKQIKEVILATNSTLDGETTALYLSKLIQMKNIEISRIAYGMPMGGQLDYADELTLSKALKGRTKI
ncbi:MAG: recombination mediator RecR [Erysipelotrichaceae bacterium]